MPLLGRFTQQDSLAGRSGAAEPLRTVGEGVAPRAGLAPLLSEAGRLAGRMEELPGRMGDGLGEVGSRISKPSGEPMQFTVRRLGEVAGERRAPASAEMFEELKGEGVAGDNSAIMLREGQAAEGEAGSAAHKAARWESYQARGGKWNYEHWSNVYESNMGRAKAANDAVDAYHQRLGWGEREVTVDVEGVPRRLDIADPATMRGIEHKTGYQRATQDVLWEVERDRILIEQGWDIRWHFEGRASKGLIDALKEASIPYTGVK